jgi:hypothetical protein
MDTAGRRTEPLSLRIGASDLTLVATDVNVLIDALQAELGVLKRRLAQLERDQPQSLEAAARSIGLLTQLAETFANAPSDVGEPPLELDGVQAHLVDDALSELRSHQRRELTSGLAELKRALYRL